MKSWVTAKADGPTLEEQAAWADALAYFNNAVAIQSFGSLSQDSIDSIIALAFDNAADVPLSDMGMVAVRTMQTILDCPEDYGFSN